MNNIKYITQKGLLSLKGWISIPTLSTPDHITSVQPSVVVISKSVIIEIKILSKFDLLFYQVPPYYKQSDSYFILSVEFSISQ